MSGRHHAGSWSNVDMGSTHMRRSAGRAGMRASGRRTARLRPLLQELERRTLLSAQPDLVFKAATAPSNAVVGNGQNIDISWTVKNQGANITGSTDWDDTVYLSPTQIFNAANRHRDR